MTYVEFDEQLPWCDWCSKPIDAPIIVLREGHQIVFFIGEGRAHIFKKRLAVPADVIEPEEVKL